MPEWFFVAVVAVFGLVIGSFLNVFIYRLHTGKSLNDRSHCLSCGETLRWYELFPVFSYLALRGRCRSCRSFIPYRYALVELLTSGLFVLAYLTASGPAHFVFLLAFLSVLVVVLVYDLYHMIIPDELSLTLGLIALAVSVHEAYVSDSLETLIYAVAGGAAAFVFFGSLWWLSDGRWIGFGDAKLAVSLGVMVGLSGAFSLVVWAFWIGASLSLLLILGQRLHKYSVFRLSSGVTMKSEIPFAPFLILSFLLVYFFDADVLGLVGSLYGI